MVVSRYDDDDGDDGGGGGDDDHGFLPRHIPTMTKYHHGANMAIMNLVRF